MMHNRNLLYYGNKKFLGVTRFGTREFHELHFPEVTKSIYIGHLYTYQSSAKLEMNNHVVEIICHNIYEQYNSNCSNCYFCPAENWAV